MAGNDPFDDDDEDIDDIFKEMQRLFEELFNENGPFNPEGGFGGQHEAVTDIREHDDSVVVVIDAAGFDKNDINVRAVNGALRVSGQNVRGDRLNEEIPLPDGAEPEDATTRFNNGILEIEVPLSNSDGLLDL